MADCIDCQWCWLSEEDDKYNEPDYIKSLECVAWQQLPEPYEKGGTK